jgi:hypothetical protein
MYRTSPPMQASPSINPEPILPDGTDNAPYSNT